MKINRKISNTDAPVLDIYSQFGEVVRRDSFYMIRDIIKEAIDKHEFPVFEVL